MPATLVNTTHLDGHNLRNNSRPCLIHQFLNLPDNIQYDAMAPICPRKQDGDALVYGRYCIDITEHHFEDYSSAPHITRFMKRDEREDTIVPGPPPLYTPSIPLHASIAPYEEATPTLVTTPQETGIVKPSTLPTHGTNVGLLVGAVLAASAVLLLFAGLGRYLVRQKAKTILRSHPRFSMWRSGVDRPQVVEETEDKAKACSSEFGQFVYVSNSDGDVNKWSKQDDSGEEGNEAETNFQRPWGATLHPEDQPSMIVRRFSAPGALEELKAAMPRSSTGIPTSISAPASPSLCRSIDRDESLWIQRQKAAELAQIVRMRIVRDEMPVHRAASSCPDLSFKARATVGIDNSLGIVREEQEVDISGSVLSALESYSVSLDPMSPNIPLTSLFRVDHEGKVTRVQSSPSVSSGEHIPSDPVTPSTSGASSSFTESCSGEIESAVIVRMAQTRSMEIKRGLLVAMDFQGPPVSRSAPMLMDTQICKREADAPTIGPPSSPPSLSPIVPFTTSLSADIELSLEERIFAYRESGEWSRENYKLTTPGQVRALVEALAISRPSALEHQPERGWPWPAQRQ